MKKKLYIIGAGGHGKVILDCALSAGFEVVGIFDDNIKLLGKKIAGAEVLGRIDLAKKAIGPFVVAIGDNNKRKLVVDRLGIPDENFAIVIHPSAVVGRDVTLLPGSMIIAGVVINTGSVIGRHTIINTSSSIDHHNEIGDLVHIAPGVHTGGYVDVGELSFIGLGASIVNDVKIGKKVVVGAGSVVIKDIPDNVTVVGIPARVIKKGSTVG